MPNFTSYYSSAKYETVEINLWIDESIRNSNDIFLYFEEHIKKYFSDDSSSWISDYSAQQSRPKNMLRIRGVQQKMAINYTVRYRQEDKGEREIFKDTIILEEQQ